MAWQKKEEKKKDDKKEAKDKDKDKDKDGAAAEGKGDEEAGKKDEKKEKPAKKEKKEAKPKDDWWTGSEYNGKKYATLSTAPTKVSEEKARRWQEQSPEDPST